jgi:uncharacterized protein (TIGR03085 family)
VKSLAATERAALSDLMDDVGPDHPTLCEGWLTRHLAAHIVMRERRPDTKTGPLSSRLARRSDRVREFYLNLDWPDLVGLVREGPQPPNPLSWPALDQMFSGVELYIHHEDVRRASASWEPRQLPEPAESELWRRLRPTAFFALRRVAVGVAATTPEGRLSHLHRGTSEVLVKGPPGEILLFVSGRKRAARVELSGESWAVSVLEDASMGL